jgi:uncharacterized protein YhaN
MEAEQDTQEEVHYEEEEANEESVEHEVVEQQNEQEAYVAPEETAKQGQEQEKEKSSKFNNHEEDRSSFVHGLSVGLGIGCIATFVIMWITVFFTPQLPSLITYEAMLSIFIYPLIYLLAVGLIALTAGIVREYYVRKKSF